MLKQRIMRGRSESMLSTLAKNARLLHPSTRGVRIHRRKAKSAAEQKEPKGPEDHPNVCPPTMSDRPCIEQQSLGDTAVSLLARSALLGAPDATFET